MKPEIDKTEKVIRLGCGAIFGLFIGVFLGVRVFFRHGNGNSNWVAILAISLAVIFGILALLRGDEFWESVSDFFKRW